MQHTEIINNRGTKTRGTVQKGFKGDLEAHLRVLLAMKLPAGSPMRYRSIRDLIKDELSPEQAVRLYQKLRDPNNELRHLLNAKLSDNSVNAIVNKHLVKAAFDSKQEILVGPGRRVHKSRATTVRGLSFKPFTSGDVESHFSDIIKTPVPPKEPHRFARLEHFFGVELSPTQAARLHAKLVDENHYLRRKLDVRIAQTSVPKLLKVLEGRAFGNHPTTDPRVEDNSILLKRFYESERRVSQPHTDPFIEADHAEIFSEIQRRGLALTPAPPDVLEHINIRRDLHEATQTGDYSGIDPYKATKTDYFHNLGTRAGAMRRSRYLRKKGKEWVPYKQKKGTRAENFGRPFTVYVDRENRGFTVQRQEYRNIDENFIFIYELWKVYTSKRNARLHDTVDRFVAWQANVDYPWETGDVSKLHLSPRRPKSIKPQPLVNRKNRRKMAKIGILSADEILKQSIKGLQVHWSSPREGLKIFITPGGQLVGSKKALDRFVAHHPKYAGWQGHHIVEQVHLERQGVRNLFRQGSEMPCVLLSQSEHISRIKRILARGNQPNKRIPNQITAREYYELYQEAYTTVLGAYTGLASSRKLSKELMQVVRLMLGFK